MNSLQAGITLAVAPGVRRLVAPNPSVMTGPGTNTYLLGEPPCAVIDPGPDDEAHLTRIRVAVPHLAHVFVTHTHADHSRGTRSLAASTGARVIGVPSPADRYHDATFASDVEPARDQLFELGTLRLRAIDTPGHASNHVCYLLEGEGMLFSGDHILDGVTPVIIPPDGDMQAYLESLRRLRAYPLRSIAPGHGRVLADPIGVIDGIIEHRMMRESKVRRALQEAGHAEVAQLLPHVYDDVNRALHRLARLSLEAHLIKLEREGLCAREGEVWKHLAA